MFTNLTTAIDAASTARISTDTSASSNDSIRNEDWQGTVTFEKQKTRENAKDVNGYLNLTFQDPNITNTDTLYLKCYEKHESRIRSYRIHTNSLRLHGNTTGLFLGLDRPKGSEYFTNSGKYETKAEDALQKVKEWLQKFFKIPKKSQKNNENGRLAYSYIQTFTIRLCLSKQKWQEFVKSANTVRNELNKYERNTNVVLTVVETNIQFLDNYMKELIATVEKYRWFEAVKYGNLLYEIIAEEGVVFYFTCENQETKHYQFLNYAVIEHTKDRGSSGEASKKDFESKRKEKSIEDISKITFFDENNQPIEINGCRLKKIRLHFFKHAHAVKTIERKLSELSNLRRDEYQNYDRLANENELLILKQTLIGLSEKILKIIKEIKDSDKFNFLKNRFADIEYSKTYKTTSIFISPVLNSFISSIEKVCNEGHCSNDFHAFYSNVFHVVSFFKDLKSLFDGPLVESDKFVVAVHNLNILYFEISNESSLEKLLHGYRVYVGKFNGKKQELENYDARMELYCLFKSPEYDGMQFEIQVTNCKQNDRVLKSPLFDIPR